MIIIKYLGHRFVITKNITETPRNKQKETLQSVPAYIAVRDRMFGFATSAVCG